MFVGFVDQLVECTLGAVAVGAAGEERVGGEQGGDRFELALGFGVVAFECGVEVDRQVAALGPLGPLGQQHDAPSEDEHEAGWLVDGEQLADRVSGAGDLLLVTMAEAWLEEAPGCLRFSDALWGSADGAAAPSAGSTTRGPRPISKISIDPYVGHDARRGTSRR